MLLKVGLSLQVTLAEFLILLCVKNEQPVTFKHTSALSQTHVMVSTNGNHITHFNTKIDPKKCLRQIKFCTHTRLVVLVQTEL